MATANPKHSDFISQFRAGCKGGIGSLADLAPLIKQYLLLYGPGGADPLTADDFAGTNADSNLADIAAAVQVFAAVDVALSANNNAGYIAALKVGR